MDALYSVDVQAFKPDDHPLRPLLRACMASLIMYHFDVLKDFKMTNLIPRKVLAKICDGEHSDPTKVLRHWSTRKIREDFLARNPNGPDPLPEGDLRESLLYLVKENQTFCYEIHATNSMNVEQQCSTEDQQQLIQTMCWLVQTIASQMAGASVATRSTPIKQDDNTMYLPVTPGVAVCKASKQNAPSSTKGPVQKRLKSSSLGHVVTTGACITVSQFLGELDKNQVSEGC
jgi:hypothetical protein